MAAASMAVTAFLVNAGDDLHAIGSLAPIANYVGCIVIAPDSSRHLARIVADPLTSEPGP